MYMLYIDIEDIENLFIPIAMIKHVSNVFNTYLTSGTLT